MKTHQIFNSLKKKDDTLIPLNQATRTNIDCDPRAMKAYDWQETPVIVDEMKGYVSSNGIMNTAKLLDQIHRARYETPMKNIYILKRFIGTRLPIMWWDGTRTSAPSNQKQIYRRAA